MIVPICFLIGCIITYYVFIYDRLVARRYDTKLGFLSDLFPFSRLIKNVGNWAFEVGKDVKKRFNRLK